MATLMGCDLTITRVKPIVPGPARPGEPNPHRHSSMIRVYECPPEISKSYAAIASNILPTSHTCCILRIELEPSNREGVWRDDRCGASSYRCNR
jgi:hypothetical protein